MARLRNNCASAVWLETQTMIVAENVMARSLNISGNLIYLDQRTQIGRPNSTEIGEFRTLALLLRSATEQILTEKRRTDQPHDYRYKNANRFVLHPLPGF